MSAHDHLMAELVRLRSVLEDYTNEFDPPNGGTALLKMNDLLLTVNKFLEEEIYG